MNGPGPEGTGPADEVPRSPDPAPPAVPPPGPSGGMRFQDPTSATRREPTLAEQRERERVRREAEQQARLQAEQDAADENKKRKRRTMLIGGGVAVGLVGVVAATYLAVTDNDDTNYESAKCVDENGVVVPDSQCGGTGTHGAGGMFFFMSGGHRYQYYYGGNSPVGQKATGGALTPSSGKSYANSSGNAVTNDGKTGGAVSRGGFGSKSGGSSSKGGSSSGGKSSGS